MCSCMCVFLLRISNLLDIYQHISCVSSLQQRCFVSLSSIRYPFSFTFAQTIEEPDEKKNHTYKWGKNASVGNDCSAPVVYMSYLVSHAYKWRSSTTQFTVRIMNSLTQDNNAHSFSYCILKTLCHFSLQLYSGSDKRRLQATEVMANELEDVSEYQTVKKVLRAILIAAGTRGLTLRELSKQYHDYEGRSIPFDQFGFQRLEIFLLNMTDTVRWVTIDYLIWRVGVLCTTGTIL